MKILFYICALLVCFIILIPLEFFFDFANLMNEKSRLESGQSEFSISENLLLVGFRLLATVLIITCSTLLIRLLFLQHTKLKDTLNVIVIAFIIDNLLFLKNLVM